MTSALVYVQNHNGGLIKCRALLDTCASTNFISESIVKRLNIPVYTQPLLIGAINGISTESKGLVHISIKSIHDDFTKNLTCLIIPTITDSVPSEVFPRNTIRIPGNVSRYRKNVQVQVHNDDRRYQRIIWRRDGEIKTFQLNTLTFGVASSPFLAIRTIQKLAEDEQHLYPRAAEVLKSHLYVDDLLTGAETIDDARILRDEVITLLARGGFNIRQWASNDKRVINDLTPNALHANLALNADHALKTLGITWNIQNDEIRYLTKPIGNATKITKRNILSESAKIFDPLGLLGPVILYIKKIMQDVWRCGLHWDESVPQTIHSDWLEFTRQWETMGQISFPRKLLTDDCQDVQLHGFCDASNTGYGACIYIRSLGKDGNVVVRLLCAKSRVAPLKTITIPRLELCGALVLAQLYRETKDTLRVTINRTVFWSDSTIVLHWLNTTPHLLKTYIANRVATIQEITGSHEWRHVRTADNPADAISRGQLPFNFLRNRAWSTGPTWLIRSESEWPNEFEQLAEIPELKKNICLLSVHTDLDIFGKYSSYSKLLRVIAYCLRFRPNNKYSGTLCAEEINIAETKILKLLQAHQFADTIQELSNNSIYKGKFANLSPFIDENGLVRVGGRLHKSDLTFSQRHPILLPNRHCLTDNIIRELHKKHYHAGIQTTLYILRQRFWVSDGRNQAVHLEVVSELTSDGFIAALRRFIARRGLPQHIYSDNGTNFVGANNQLKEIYALLNSEEHKTRVSEFALEQRITWHFIPPLAPHFGGLWESTVKSFKHHVKRVIGKTLFTFEELCTFTTEIEGILNSRPIATISSDPNDLLVLSPAHYLIGKPVTSLPENDLLSVPDNRLSVWQHIAKMRQDFWARWSLEYLNELQVRGKWKTDGPKLTIGAVVLIKEKNLPCTRWMLGKVTSIHPGEDGITRAATIKTTTGEIKRSAKSLCILPIE
ncbi:uncharacterized protein LOC105203973 [Solenopsis invicta]|uniref:uncharacterized protein LOC105203973 n=1 Tax=Solenopsis invicta TaxID=13686 RepID=UPI00193D6DBC|nr:uncharacterized protein LOC105203973 [Solenopsis invicta]